LSQLRVPRELMPVEPERLIHQPFNSSAGGIDSGEEDVVIARDREVGIVQAELDEADASVRKPSDCVEVCPCTFRVADRNFREAGSVWANAPQLSSDTLRVRDPGEEYGFGTHPGDAGIVGRLYGNNSAVQIG